MKIIPSTMYNGMRVVALCMEKGGVGKTTLAIHLAIQAALGAIPEIKKKILVIDVDSQQNSSSTLLSMESVEGEGYLVPPLHPLFDPNDPEDAEWGGRCNSIDLYYGNPVLPYESELHSRIDVLPADGDLLGDFEDFTKKSEDNSLLDSIHHQMFKFFKGQDVQEIYDLIIIDCPPGKNIITTPVLRSATDLIMPAEAQPYSLNGVHRLIMDAQKENKHRECDINIVGVIPNKIDTRKNNGEKAALEKLYSSKHTSEFMFPTQIHRRVCWGFQNIPEHTQSKMFSLGDSKGEAELINFIGHVRNKMYGAEFIPVEVA